MVPCIVVWSVSMFHSIKVGQNSSADPATVVKLLKKVQAQQKQQAAQQSAARSARSSVSLRSGPPNHRDFLLYQMAQRQHAKRQQEQAEDQRRQQGMKQSQHVVGTVTFSQFVESSGGKVSTKHIAAGDPYEKLAYADIKHQTEAGQTLPLANPKSGDACGPDKVAVTVTDAFSKSKKDGKYVFDVVCDLETKACSKDGTCGASTEKYLEVLEERQNHVYRFLDHMAIDIDVIGSYFKEFQSKLQETFQSNPGMKAKVEKALNDLQFVYQVVERDMVYCSAKLRDAQTTGSQSMREALSDLAFSGCDLKMTSHLLNAVRVLYFRRMQTVRRIMETIVTGYDFHKFREERAEAGVTNEWFRMGNWGVTGISIAIRERFASASAFVGNALASIGSKTIISFVAVVFAALVVTGAVVPSSVLAAFGFTTSAGAVSAAGTMASGWYAGVSASLTANTTIALEGAMSGISYVLPNWAMYLVTLMPMACTLFGQVDLLAKAMDFLRGQIKNYASGQGYVFQPIRNLLSKVGTIIQTRKRLRSAVLRASTDPTLASQKADYDYLEQYGEVGWTMKTFLIFCNIIIGMTQSNTAQAALWMCRTVNAAKNGSIAGFASGTASAVGTLTANLTGNSILQGALSGGMGIFEKLSGKDVMPADVIEEINKVREQFANATGSQEWGNVLPGMTADGIIQVTKEQLLQAYAALVGDDSADYNQLRTALGGAVTDALFLPQSVWKHLKDVGMRGLLSLVASSAQSAMKSVYTLMVEVAPDAAIWVYQSIAGYSPEQIVRTVIKKDVADAQKLISLWASSKVIDQTRQSIEQAQQMLLKASTEGPGHAAKLKEYAEALAGGAIEGAAKEVADHIIAQTTSNLQSLAPGMSASEQVKAAVTAGAAAVSKIKTLKEKLVLLPEDATVDQMYKLYDDATQAKLKDMVVEQQRAGVFNRIAEAYDSFKVTFFDIQDAAINEVLGAQPIVLEREDFIASLVQIRADNPEYHSKVVKMLGADGTASSGAFASIGSKVVLPRDFYNMSYSDDKLQAIFKGDFQQEMAIYAHGLTVRGLGRTFDIKVRQAYRWTVNKSFEARDYAAGKITEFANMAIEDQAWFLGTVIFALMVITGVSWATSMSQEEMFEDSERESAEIKKLLAQSNGSLEESLDTFGRIRAVPNAAAVYQRARTVHGLNPAEALQAVAQAFDNVCPPGSTDCQQPDKSMFDTSLPGHRADLSKIAAKGLSRKDQERLMAEKISSMFSQLNA